MGINTKDSDELVQKANFISTVIPDGSTVISSISLIEQVLNINYSELQSFFQQIQEIAKASNPLETAKAAALLTVSILKPGAEKWAGIVRNNQDQGYTLGRCIRENANLCFHRGLFFNLLMQQVGIPCATLEGRWIENARQDIIHNNPDDLWFIEGGARIAKSDKHDGHVWNLIQLGNKVFLVDTAYLYKADGITTPVMQEVAYHPPQNGHWKKPEDRYFKLPLPNGQIRHYMAQGMITV